MPTKENPGERVGENISFWERTAQKFRTAPLSENLTADVCVVGAGIAGVSTAYLAARGRNQRRRARSQQWVYGLHRLSTGGAGTRGVARQKRSPFRGRSIPPRPI